MAKKKIETWKIILAIAAVFIIFKYQAGANAEPFSIYYNDYFQQDFIHGRAVLKTGVLNNLSPVYHNELIEEDATNFIIENGYGFLIFENPLLTPEPNERLKQAYYEINENYKQEIANLKESAGEDNSMELACVSEIQAKMTEYIESEVVLVGYVDTYTGSLTFKDKPLIEISEECTIITPGLIKAFTEDVLNYNDYKEIASGLNKFKSNFCEDYPPLIGQVQQTDSFLGTAILFCEQQPGDIFSIGDKITLTLNDFTDSESRTYKLSKLNAEIYEKNGLTYVVVGEKAIDELDSLDIVNFGDIVHKIDHRYAIENVDDLERGKTAGYTVFTNDRTLAEISETIEYNSNPFEGVTAFFTSSENSTMIWIIAGAVILLLLLAGGK